MRIELAVATINLIEPSQNILLCSLKILASEVIRKVIRKRTPSNLCLEITDVVEEEDERAALKPPGIDNGIPEDKCLLQKICVGVLDWGLIVRAKIRNKYDRCDVVGIKMMDPFLTSTSYSTNVDNVGRSASQQKMFPLSIPRCEIQRRAGYPRLLGHNQVWQSFVCR